MPDHLIHYCIALRPSRALISNGSYCKNDTVCRGFSGLCRIICNPIIFTALAVKMEQFLAILLDSIEFNHENGTKIQSNPRAESKSRGPIKPTPQIRFEPTETPKK